MEGLCEVFSDEESDSSLELDLPGFLRKDGLPEEEEEEDFLLEDSPEEIFLRPEHEIVSKQELVLEQKTLKRKDGSPYLFCIPCKRQFDSLGAVGYHSQQLPHLIQACPPCFPPGILRKERDQVKEGVKKKRKVESTKGVVYSNPNEIPTPRNEGDFSNETFQQPLFQCRHCSLDFRLYQELHEHIQSSPHPRVQRFSSPPDRGRGEDDKIVDCGNAELWDVMLENGVVLLGGKENFSKPKPYKLSNGKMVTEGAVLTSQTDFSSTLEERLIDRIKQNSSERSPSLSLTDEFEISPRLSSISPKHEFQEEAVFSCDICHIGCFTTKMNYDQHVQGKKHQANLDKKRRKEFSNRTKQGKGKQRDNFKNRSSTPPTESSRSPYSSGTGNYPEYSQSQPSFAYPPYPYSPRPQYQHPIPHPSPSPQYPQHPPHYYPPPQYQQQPYPPTQFSQPHRHSQHPPPYSHHHHHPSSNSYSQPHPQNRHQRARSYR